MTAEFFKNNRQKLLSAHSGDAPIVIASNGLMQKSADASHPFTQDKNFWYLTGIDTPNAILVIEEQAEYLIIPKLSRTKEIFDGTIDKSELMKRSGITEICEAEVGWKKLSAKLKETKKVATIPAAPEFIESIGTYTSPARRMLIQKFKSENAQIEIIDIAPIMRQMRSVKQPEELASIKKAVDITKKSLSKIEQKYLAGNYTGEAEVEEDLNHYFRIFDAEGHGFEPIIAHGKKACTLHATNNTGPIKNGALLLDVGAQFNGYSADLSRTWMKHPTERFEQVKSAVQQTADYAISLLKPGVLLKDYEKLIENFMGQQLITLGLIKTINKQSVRKYFPHSTSHFLGLDVHDVGDYVKGLEQDMVITVEPGIYIPEESLGVRIEDDVLITKTAATKL